MSDVTLSSAVRQNLLSLQNTQSLTNVTQNRLSTGLKVASATDDPVAYFQAKSLSDRASDFSNTKSVIDQGVSSLSTALQGITSIQTLVSQLKGLALNASTITSPQAPALVSQYNTLRTQLNLLADDTQYQGLNLVAGTGTQLSVSFSNLTASTLVVNSVDVTAAPTGLNIAQAVTANGGFNIGWTGTDSGVAYNSGAQISVTYEGTATSFASGTVTFAYGTQTLSITVHSAGSTSAAGALTTTSTFQNGTAITLILSTGAAGYVTTGATVNGNNFAVENAAVSSGSAPVSGSSIVVDFTGLTGNSLNSGSYTFAYGGTTLSFNVASAGDTTSGTFTTTSTFVNGQSITLTLASNGDVGTAANVVGAAASTTFSGGISAVSYLNGSANIAIASLSNGTAALGQVAGQVVLDPSVANVLNNLVTDLSNNLTTLRSQAQSLGTNVALLNTRLDFTNNYINLLTEGGGKLTLADINTEGANLTALQTRQQLGIQTLAFAGQNERAVLSLFR